MTRIAAVLALVWLATVAADTPSPTPTATATPTQAPTPTPPPTPTPHGSVNLSVASAPSGAQINVSGSGFNPGEPIVVFLDGADHTLAPAVADGSGNFNVAVSLNGVAAGTHQVCVQQQPQPRPADVGRCR